MDGNSCKTVCSSRQEILLSELVICVSRLIEFAYATFAQPVHCAIAHLWHSDERTSAQGREQALVAATKRVGGMNNTGPAICVTCRRGALLDQGVAAWFRVHHP